MTQGFLNLHKPLGLTSHDCVARVRKLLRTKRVGHGGTLDPAATGVLPIALGRATRLLQYLSHAKAYRATVRFGMVTATDDLQGAVQSEQPCADLTLAQVQQKLPLFLGKVQQIPPSYSAIQVGGKRLYDLARAGQAIAAPVRTVEIHNIEILNWRSGDYPELDLAIACGTGTYIRAIARDLGAVLETGGTLAALERTHSSGFELADSLSLDELADLVEREEFEAIAPDFPLAHLPSLTLDTETAKRWCQGQKIAQELAPGLYQVRLAAGEFLGIGEQVEGVLLPKMAWAYDHAF